MMSSIHLKNYISAINFMRSSEDMPRFSNMTSSWIFWDGLAKLADPQDPTRLNTVAWIAQLLALRPPLYVHVFLTATLTPWSRPDVHVASLYLFWRK
jgi:hypothetical protein